MSLEFPFGFLDPIMEGDPKWAQYKIRRAKRVEEIKQLEAQLPGHQAKLIVEARDNIDGTNGRWLT